MKVLLLSLPLIIRFRTGLIEQTFETPSMYIYFVKTHLTLDKDIFDKLADWLKVI